MRRPQFLPTLILAAFAGAAAAGSARAENWVEVPEYDVAAYRFVSEVSDASAVFLNPSTLGLRWASELYGDVVAGEDKLDEVTVGLRLGWLGAGYWHRDVAASRLLPPPESPGIPGAGEQDNNLDRYVLGASAGQDPWIRLGVSYVWTNSDLPGPNAGAWLLGAYSRPVRWLSLGVTVDNANKPQFLDGRLRPRYRYAATARPFTKRLYFLTLSVEGANYDGSSRIDMAYGARILTVGGLQFGLQIDDRNGESPVFGFSAMIHIDQGALGVRMRKMPDSDRHDVRAGGEIHVYDSKWQMVKLLPEAPQKR